MIYYIIFSFIVTDKKLFHNLGKQATQYSSTKKGTPQNSPTIDQLHLQTQYINYSPVHSLPYFLHTEKFIKYSKAAKSHESAAAYADDMAAITNNIKALQTQLNKIQRLNTCVGMNLTISKCAITCAPYKSKMTIETFKAYIQIHKITYNNKIIPTLHQNEPYKYLGIQLIPSLKWNLQCQISTDKLVNQSKQLLASPTTIKQKIKIVNTVLRPGVEYSFHAIPYSMPDIKKFNKQIITLTKAICKIPKSTPNLATQ